MLRGISDCKTCRSAVPTPANVLRTLAQSHLVQLAARGQPRQSHNDNRCAYLNAARQKREPRPCTTTCRPRGFFGIMSRAQMPKAKL